MYWRSLFYGLQRLLAWQPWALIAAFISIRTLLNRAAHYFERQISPRQANHRAHLAVLASESIFEGALMGMVVLALFMVFTHALDATPVSSIGTLLPPVMEHGAIESLVITFVLLLASRAKGVKRFLEMVPSFKTFVEGFLLFHFCREEFAHYLHTAGIVLEIEAPATVPSGLASTPLHYAVGFFIVGLLFEWILLAAGMKLHSWLLEKGVRPDRARTLTQWLTLADGVVAGFVPLAMYAELLGV